jgi:all-trans-retinol dehydrogenase (NAD+)
METPDNKIELTMGVNVMAHFWTVKAFLQPMLDRNDGHIVGISSAAGFFPSARMTEYCTSKYAARGFMEALRIELTSLGKSGVKTTLVAPAHINTDLFSGYNMGGTMQPEWVAQQVIYAMRIDKAMQFLPWYISLGNLWQGVFPTFIWDLFMLPTNSSLNKWNPTQANKIFDKMEKKN